MFSDKFVMLLKHINAADCLKKKYIWNVILNWLTLFLNHSQLLFPKRYNMSLLHRFFFSTNVWLQFKSKSVWRTNISFYFLQTGEGYFEAFKNELEAFKTRVRIWSQSHGFQTMLLHDLSVSPGCVGEWTSFLQVGLLFLRFNWTKAGLGPT